MKYVEIRQAFTDFFKSHKHELVESSGLVPMNDPTLMFTNAGMNQFKDVFLGTDQRPYNRAVTIQKCLRAGGKHNDLENVGFTARHHTFFEMMGNFSFGDYFKKEAIGLAWSFLTETLKIPKERLYVTVFTTDDEAAEIWEKQIGIPKEKIFRYGEKDNFWRMGKTGPCGPCSEIFYDHNPSGPQIPIHEDEDRFVEIWNLVFMQFFEDESGNQSPLPSPSVDTGAGIERIAAAMQGCKDNYQCDIFQPLIQKACDVAGIENNWQKLAQNSETLGAVKVVSDHARTAAFLISEGVLPSNEGKGYVLRRIMRRAIRYARKLNDKQSLYPQVCEEVIATMAPHYPILKEKEDFILNAVRAEEKRFLQTLDNGSEILIEEIKKFKSQGLSELPGQAAVTLYDTYGFPFDLTELIAKEHGMTVNIKDFEKNMEALKDLARKAHKSHNISSNEKHLGEWTQSLTPSDFVGYEQLNVQSELLSLSDGETTVPTLTDSGWLVFKSTPFYAEGGGQVADQGHIYDAKTNRMVGQVKDVKKMNEVVLHYVALESEIKPGETYLLKVDHSDRQATANNHSATHLLNASLKHVLGDHVNQAGSLVNSQKLRFDFNHSKALTPDEIQRVEQLLNEQIAGAFPVAQTVMGQKEAIAAGATAMFGEKYADEVRVISMGSMTDAKSFSMELCGGTHVSNTSQIRLCKILSETGVAAGVRRIEAITGTAAFEYLNRLAEENMGARQLLNERVPGVDDGDQLDGQLILSIEDLKTKVKRLEKELQQQKAASVSIEDITSSAEEKSLLGEPGLALFTRVAISDRNLMSDVVDKIRDKHQRIAMVLIGESEDDKPRPMIVAVSKDLKKLHAGKITKELCSVMDGKGGGRPDFAQGSIGNIDKLNAAKDRFNELLES